MNDNSKIIGAGWEKVSNNGLSYISISLDVQEIREIVLANKGIKKINAALFQNNNKKSDTHPDCRLVYSERK